MEPPKIHPEASKKSSKNEGQKYDEKLSKFDSKMEPKMNQKGTPMFRCSSLFGVPKRFANTAPFFCRFWRPLGAFWPPSGPLFAHSGSFWGAFGGFWTTNRKAKPSKTSETDPNASGNEKLPRICRDSAEDCREPAKNCREPSQNPPRTCRTNLKQRKYSTIRLLRIDFVLRQTLQQNA